jgi:HSP20 family molecular chaperone IbpA
MSFFTDLIPFQGFRPARRGADVEGEQFVAPVYELKESKDAYGLEAHVPGATKDAVEIQVDQGELVVTARRTWKAPEGWTEIFRESSDATFRLRLDLNEAVDVEKINAELEQGILRLTLPKAEALKPRKIAIS